MYLLILDSLGTTELMLIAMVALLVFGPRKIPELARKAGKIMQELRQVSSEFRSTWEREVNLDDDEKDALDFSDLSLDSRTIAAPVGKSLPESPEKAETTETTASSETKATTETTATAANAEKAAMTTDSPNVREINDPETLEKLKSQASPASDEATDKQNWL